MQPIEYAISDIMPHSGKMLLLDCAIAGNDTHFECEVTINADNLFFTGTGVGAWVGVEYMAQTVAAWAGWQARLAGQTPKIGFLLGSRRYSCSVSEFALGQVLRIRISRAFQADNGLGQFDCQILINQQEVAQAALTVFEPLDASAFLAERAKG
ncbi:ApeP family dehydratase [Janthinobacterium sp. B9-8]|uniref:ApeP family dehydratase n=1 Tax=Janthinobacterium sp. B9-8 TaxID=1236179 RepID=UPI00061D12BF|nr:hotdog family protein [Janthinobacterium sp. B9-8]AMC34397.1 3-hydroxylacyl-ACP dehydratase [Janthinobacterium sp. B9-8]